MSFTNYDPIGQRVSFIDERFYTKDNVIFYPGVTTILGVVDKGSQYKRWLQTNGMNADVIMREAMNEGSRIHEAIELFLKGNEINWATDEGVAIYTKSEWIKISKFMDFYDNFKPDIIAIEMIIVSDKLQYGSQLDLICKLNGQRFLIDHKSGGLYDFGMQLAAMRELWNENFPKEPIEKCAVLHLDATTRGRDKQEKISQGIGWKLVEIDEIDKQFEDFKHVQAIWKRQNPNFRPQNLIYPSSYKRN